MIGLGRGNLYLPEHGGEIISDNLDFSEELYILASRPEYVVEVQDIKDADPNTAAKVVCKRCPPEDFFFK